MFEPSDCPRVFAIPHGVDFSAAFVDGLLSRTRAMDPADVARVEVWVNTRRTARRLAELLSADGARLLPRIRPIGELGQGISVPGLSPAIPPLRRRLQLSRIIAALIERQPMISPRSAVFDLADSLSGLIAEMHEEGVTPDRLLDLRLEEVSSHWERSAEFIRIITRFFGPGSAAEPDVAARQRMVIEQQIEAWATTTPDHPILVAGSTGSRGTTHMMMRAVAGLPQGAVILPGYDDDLSVKVWRTIADQSCQDHPQYRFAKIRQDWGLTHADILPWGMDAKVANPERNRLLSLAMRPAPVTDQWIVEAPLLTGLDRATEGLTLIEAPNTRAEALAISLAMRQAVEDGQVAALVTPDRNLTRQVAAIMDRWGITPDDSAGEPVSQSATGRLLRHMLGLMGRDLTAEALMTLLKHPLVGSGNGGRQAHLNHVERLELLIRRSGPPFPDASYLDWLAADPKAIVPGWTDWLEWIKSAFLDMYTVGSRRVFDHMNLLLDRAVLAVNGPGPMAGDSPLWTSDGGRESLRIVDALRREAEHGGALDSHEFHQLFETLLREGEIRKSVTSHPQVRFWGTLEARVQGADLTILAGLNEGTWPASPDPDPWMSRKMRSQIGLTLPERRIGLSAHDFHQAASAPRVILSRSLRDDAAETVPSRWVSRLSNLLAGLRGTGDVSLKAMVKRGADLLDLAQQFDQPDKRTDPEPRPAPRPPVSARPRKLSVTEIQTLIRDPFAIYATHVLGLKKLDPIRKTPDAMMAGTIIHDVMERFVRASLIDPSRLTRKDFLSTADQVLAIEAHWPGIRIFWRARMERIADFYLQAELERRRIAAPVVLEVKSEYVFSDPLFTLTGKADRIDLREDGDIDILDYKSGAAPKPKDLLHFDKQLMLEAIMVENGAFSDVVGRKVANLIHVSLSNSPQIKGATIAEDDVRDASQKFRQLIASYLDERKGFAALRAWEGQRWDSDYNHLARFGEWATSDPITPLDVR